MAFGAAVVRNWIFDLDGTLTRPVHDFDALCARLSLEPGTPILEAISTAEPERADWLAQEVEKWEWEAAERAEPAVGARDLLSSIESGRLAILTRNRRDIAIETLRAIGFLHFFDLERILGRDEAKPKPSPSGIQFILDAAGWQANETMMVGDYVYDIQAGKSAGCRTVLVDPSEHGLWDEWADVRVKRLDELCSMT